MSSKYPSEVIDLPSNGDFYPKDHPLSSGKIDIKYMTAREEDILASTSLIQKGIVLDKLVESVIVDSSININDLLVGDKNAIVLASRIMAFGENYDVVVTCPSCFEKNKTSIDLSELEPKKIENPPKNNNSFEMVLPESGIKITYRHMTHELERKIEDDIQAYNKVRGNDVNRRRSTEYRYLITSVNGEHNPSKIRDFIENEFRIKDSRAFVAELEKNDPDIDTTFNFSCSKCNHADRLEVPIDTSFLWPT